MYFNLAEEAFFFDPLFLLTFLLFLSLFSLNLSFCPLHSGVHCHSAFGPLCVLKKMETFIYKESTKASSTRIIWSSALWKEPGDHSDHIVAHKLIFCSTLCAAIFHEKHATLLIKWLSAFLASIHSEAPTVFFSLISKCWVKNKLLDGPGWHTDVTLGGWHVVWPRTVKLHFHPVERFGSVQFSSVHYFCNYFVRQK